MPTTRSTFRQEIGRALGRRYFTTGTTSGVSTVNKILDARRTETRREWDGATIYFASVSAPTTALVRGGSGDAGLVFLDTDLGGAPASGAAYELLKGFTLDDYNEAINHAHRGAWPYLYDALDDDTTVVETTNTIKYVLSADWRRILAVRREIEGSTSPKRWEDLIEGFHYFLRPSGTALAFEALYDPKSSLKLHFMGAKIATIGATDASTSDLPLEVVLHGALAWLYEKGAGPDEAQLDARFEQEATKQQQLYEAAKRQFAMRPLPRRAITPRIGVENEGMTVPGSV